MNQSFCDRASAELKSDPGSLFHWHQLITAGIQENNPPLIHHGITGSLICGIDHHVTEKLIILALKKLSRDNYWTYLTIKTVQSLGQSIFPALLPTWLELGLLKTESPIRSPEGSLSTTSNSYNLFIDSSLEQAIATLSIYAITDGPAPGSRFMNNLIQAMVHAYKFATGSTHVLTAAAHKCLAKLIAKYGFMLRCKVVVETNNIDSLSFFRQEIMPFCHPPTETSLRWISEHLALLDSDQPNDYFCAYLIAACFCALVIFDDPVKRSMALSNISDQGIRLFNVSPLVCRFFLRAAPPSLANQFLQSSFDGDHALISTDDSQNNYTSDVDCIASTENVFFRSSLDPQSDLSQSSDFLAMFPCLADLESNDFIKARTSYILGNKFAVATFGQLRQSSFKTTTKNLHFGASEFGERISFFSVASWSRVAVTRHPKTSGELSNLFARPESGHLAVQAARQISVDQIYECLVDHQNIGLKDDDLSQNLHELCPLFDRLVVTRLDEAQTEEDFKNIYPLSSSEELGTISQKILLNQFKMWNSIFAALDSYIRSGCTDPLILHRADVPLENIVQFVDSSQIFRLQNIAFLSDVDSSAFVVPPIGGMGDRFWIMGFEVARVVHNILRNLKQSALVGFLNEWNTNPNINLRQKASMMEHHRLCDTLFTLFSPSIYVVSVNNASIQRDALFDIEHEELRELLINKLNVLL